MSDFASLLGDLQKTAERAVAATKTPVKEENRKSRKRQRPENDGDNAPRKHATMPKDAARLTVKVSFMCIVSKA